MDPAVLESAYREVVDALMLDAALSVGPRARAGRGDDGPRSRKRTGARRAAREPRRSWPRCRPGPAPWPSIPPSRRAPRGNRLASTSPTRPTTRSWCPASDRGPTCPSIFVGPAETRRYRDGFDLTDPRYTPRENLREAHYCLTCHERGKDSCATGCTTSQGAVQANPLGIPLEGCPLDEKISEMIAALPRRPPGGGAGRHHDRQPDAGRHRPPDLQRLHEVVHLPEAGSGEHPADRDRHPHRGARPALRLRDRLAADPLEPAEPAPAVSAALQRQERPRGRHGSGRLHPRAPPAERGLRRRRHRGPQGRAAGRCTCAGPSGACPSPSATWARSWARSRSAPPWASAASPSTASPCAGTRTSSTSTTSCSCAARSSACSTACASAAP